jgi:aconitate hydratase
MTQLNSFGAAETLRSGSTGYRIFRLDALEKRGFSEVARLPFSIKVLLENLLRHEDGQRVTAATPVPSLPKGWRQEISFMPARPAAGLHRRQRRRSGRHARAPAALGARSG